MGNYFGVPLLILAALLQVTVIPQVRILGGEPNLVMLLVVTYAIAGSLVWNFAVRPHEEADLEARFGEAFRRYRSSVRCWWPRFDVGGAASARPTISAARRPAAGSDRDRSPIAR